MADPNKAATTRPDVDIESDVNHIFTTYLPLRHDRPFIRVSVKDGAVKLVGNTRLPQNRDMFAQRIAAVAGVQSVDVSELHDDEWIRLEAGKATPLEVHTSVTHGSVILSGHVPDGLTLESVIEAVEAIKGVRRAVPNFPAPKQG